jgi:hypothetical protein
MNTGEIVANIILMILALVICFGIGCLAFAIMLQLNVTGQYNLIISGIISCGLLTTCIFSIWHSKDGRSE